jgi:hypothetical protein
MPALGDALMSGGQRAARRALVTACLLPALVGCALPLPSPTVPPETPSTPAPSAEPVPSPTETAPAETAIYDPVRITQICEAWGGARSERTIRCSRAIKVVLDSFGAEAAQVRRIYLRFTPPCIVGGNCPSPSDDHAWASIRSPLTADLLVELTIGGDGALVAAPPRIDPAPPPSPTFDPPPIARPPIDVPLPTEVRDRRPLPLCGVESASSGGPFATDARRCFVAGILAGEPVEFITHGVGTEGEKTLTLYRFDGDGAVMRFDREARAWTWAACGIALLRTEVVFATDGVCRRGALEVSR